MRIVVYGAGYVGLVTAVCFAELGHDILCFDIDEKKIARLRQGILPIYEQGLAELLHRNQQRHKLQFSSVDNEAVEYSDVHMIAVGTPSKSSGEVDISFVENVARLLGKHRTRDTIVINKSTSPPGTVDNIYALIMREFRQRGCNFQVEVVANPEFLQEGTAVEQCMHPDRILIGSESTNAIEIMQQLYAPIIEVNPDIFITMRVRSAELAKYATNALLATKISFINEISQIAEAVGADINEVKQGIAMDYRINPAFLNAGCGFGGSCLPKDLLGLSHFAKENQIDPFLISAVIERNIDQQQLLFKKISSFFKQDLRHKTIAVWGLAFKPNTDDIRYAPSKALIDALLEAHALVQVYDPLAMEAIADYYKDKNLTLAEFPLTALQEADALVLVTEWPVFNEIPLEDIYRTLKCPVIFDGRNMFDPEIMIKAGFYYFGIGRVAINE